jgi:hypothetical protein
MGLPHARARRHPTGREGGAELPRETVMSRMEAEGDGDLTEADDRVGVISEIVEHVRLRMIPYLTSRPDLAPRHYAAACLARCNRLLSSMIALRTPGTGRRPGGAARP